MILVSLLVLDYLFNGPVVHHCHELESAGLAWKTSGDYPSYCSANNIKIIHKAFAA